MYNEKQRIIAIVNELTTFLLNNNVSSVHVSIKENEHETKIQVYCNMCDIKILEQLKSKIMSNRRKEVEELYWELLGSTSLNNELPPLLGHMIDDSSIDKVNSNIALITLIRHKSKMKNV